MARLTPRLTPYIPKPSHISPSHLAHSVPRAILTGNVPHPRISVGAVKLNTAPAKAVKPALSSLTTGTHTGRARSANPKPKTPAQLTGIKTSPARARPPRSMAAQSTPAGPHTLKGVKRQVKRSNPLRLPTLHM